MSNYIVASRCEDDEWYKIDVEAIKAWDALEALENSNIYGEILEDAGGLPEFKSYSQLIAYFMEEFRISLVVEEIFS